MPIRLIESHGGTTPARIEQFEAKHDLALPEDYRAFLLQYNGGRTYSDVFSIPGEGVQVSLFYLFGLDQPRGADLDQHLARYTDDTPAGFLIVGRDPGAGLIILGTPSSSGPGVYFWDHTHELPQSSDAENSYFIAESFEAFADVLRDEHGPEHGRAAG